MEKNPRRLPEFIGSQSDIKRKINCTEKNTKDRKIILAFYLSLLYNKFRRREMTREKE
ncbi:MAG: hypothetical protein MR867_00975 [Eubacterium sp.]|nr:hypothetical protein [Eubacterium sp.]